MIIGNLATYPARAALLPSIVHAIAPQVDQLNVLLNEYLTVPEYLTRFTNVNPIIPDHDTKDAGKFLPDCAHAEWVFLLDDDIIYPNDYVTLSLERVRNLAPGRYLTGYHGSIYRRYPSFQPISIKKLKVLISQFLFRTHTGHYRKTLHFTHQLLNSVIIEQAGSGTAIMRGIDMPPYEFIKSSQKFVDVRLARWCYETGIIVVSLPRAGDWLRPCSREELGSDGTIYEDFTKKNHTHVVVEIKKFAFKDKRVGKFCPLNEERSMDSETGWFLSLSDRFARF
jgi:hypothetical protein